MKKLTAIIMILALVCAALPGLAEELTVVHCEEQKFTTKIPAGATAVYEEDTAGLMIYTQNAGYLPYVIVKRRPLDMKLQNPENYLNNVYREYMEDKYGNDSAGMNPAKTMEIGGKELLGARYMFKLGDVVVTQLVLIEIRDGGDMEYIAKFYEGNEDITMKALEEAVRNYQEDDA